MGPVRLGERRIHQRNRDLARPLDDLRDGRLLRQLRRRRNLPTLVQHGSRRPLEGSRPRNGRRRPHRQRDNLGPESGLRGGRACGVVVQRLLRQLGRDDLQVDHDARCAQPSCRARPCDRPARGVGSVAGQPRVRALRGARRFRLRGREVHLVRTTAGGRGVRLVQLAAREHGGARRLRHAAAG